MGGAFQCYTETNETIFCQLILWCDQCSVASTWMRTFTRAESWKDIYFYYTTFARCLQYFLWFSIENLNLNQFILHSLPASLGWQTKLERIQPSKAIYRIFPPVPTQTPTINYRVSHNWVLTLFWLFSRLPELVQTFILPFFNSPGDDDSKTHLTFLPFSKIDQVTEQNVEQPWFRYNLDKPCMYQNNNI